MMRPRSILYPIFMCCLLGCASVKTQAPAGNEGAMTAVLAQQVLVLSNKFELAKKENLYLKKQLGLFKRYQEIDSQKFVDALSIFEKKLLKEIDQRDVWLRITDRGLVIIISAERLFVSGSDVLSDEGKVLLDTICGMIEDKFAPNYIYIEGHTDDQSLAVFEWKTDWDFSFGRALSVLKYFQDKGHIEPLRLSASGFGQYRARASNETKEGRRLNRRIEIIISPQKLKVGQTPLK